MLLGMGVDISRENIPNDLSIVHPVDCSRRLEVIPDPVHVFKNMVHGWINNVYLTLPAWYVEQKKLTSNIVHRSHLQALVNFEQGNQLKMSSKLTQADVNFDQKTSSVDKMKVCNATKYCNLDVAAGLHVVASETKDTSLLATAAFVEDIAIWFDLMTNRQVDKSLSLDNPDHYKYATEHLMQTARLIYDVRVGDKGYWKPWKSGLPMCTKAVLRLSDRLLNNGHKHILTARFDQDCLESLFSLIRFKQRRPTSLQFAQNLKIITLTQYMTKVPSSSYDIDDQEHLVGLMDLMKIRKEDIKKDKLNRSYGGTVQSQPEVDIINHNTMQAETDVCFDLDYESLVTESEELLDTPEQNTLYHIAGYICQKIAQRQLTCQTCLNQLLQSHPLETKSSQFTRLRTKRAHKGYNFITEQMFAFFRVMEILYRNFKASFSNQGQQLQKKILEEMNLLPSSIFHCVEFKELLVKKFVLFRLKTGEVKKCRKKKFDSRSMLY